MHLLIDPPVTAFSPPDQIIAWVAELEQLAQRPEYGDRANRKRIESALRQARRWLHNSGQLRGAPSSQSRDPVPNPRT